MGRHATFDALGTTVDVCVRQAGELDLAVRLTQDVLRDVDETCSRFREDSDLTRANAGAGGWVEVEPLLVAAVGIAVEAARLTDGLVNPLLGRPLVQLGYDRDLKLLHACEDEPAGPVDVPPVDAWQRIGLDPDGAIRVPAGTALDLGATGKAWAADLAAAACAERLTASALVNVGGDLAVSAPDGTAWTVGVAERRGDPDALICLAAGGLATSTTRIRRWTRRGVRRHHLLDPHTGLPVPEVWRTVSAAGASCTAANIASTAAVVLGAAAPAWLEANGVAARLVAADGQVRVVGGWPEERRAA